MALPALHEAQPKQEIMQQKSHIGLQKAVV